MKKFYNHYLDERKEIKKNYQFRVEGIFGDVIMKDSVSLEQLGKPINFLSQNNADRNIKINFEFFTPRKKKNTDIDSSANPTYKLYFVNLMKLYKKQTYCLGGRQYSNTNNKSVFEKVNPKTKKLVRIIKSSCGIFGRNKAQIFTK